MQKVTEQNYIHNIESSEFAILVFTSAWCTTCEKLERVLQDISAGMTRPISMAKVDITESPSVAHEFDIMGIPTMVCFRHGQPVHQITLTGGISESKISQIIDQYLVL